MFWVKSVVTWLACTYMVDKAVVVTTKAVNVVDWVVDVADLVVQVVVGGK